MYFTILIKSLLQVLCVLLFKAFFLYKILFTGMHYSSKYYKQAKNKPGETIVSDTIESSNQGQIINKIFIIKSGILFRFGSFTLTKHVNTWIAKHKNNIPNKPINLGIVPSTCPFTSKWVGTTSGS